MSELLDSIAKSAGSQTGVLKYATVKGRTGSWYLLVTDEQLQIRAKISDSCLLEPSNGDFVLVLVSAFKENVFILSILLKATPHAANISLPGHVNLNTSNGELRVESKLMTLVATEELHMSAPSFSVSGTSALMNFSSLRAVVSQVNARVTAINLIAKTLTLTAGRVVQKVRDSFRRVEQLDETRSGRIHMRVNENIQLRANRVDIRAKENVTIDGDKIDLG